MLFNEWYFNLFRIIPESIALVALGTALIKERFSFQRILMAGLIIGMVGFVFQRMPIKFGAQVPIGIVTFILVLLLVLKLNVKKSASAALLSFIFLTTMEALSILILVNVIGIPESIFTESSDLVKFMFSLIPLFLLVLLSVLFQIRLHRAKGRIEL
jgi:hypothetical protein